MVSDNREQKKESWHLDKRVPIALIMALTLQTMLFAYGYGKLYQRVDYNEKNIATVMDVMPRLVRLETLMEGVLDTLKDIREDLKEIKK